MNEVIEFCGDGDSSNRSVPVLLEGKKDGAPSGLNGRLLNRCDAMKCDGCGRKG